MEIFVYTEFIPDLSTLFPASPVEKPVENVDNSHIKSGSLTLYIRLCQLMLFISGFSWKDICFLCESFENIPVFCGKHRKLFFTFGQTYGIIKRLARCQTIFSPIAQLREKAVFSVHHPPLLGYREII